MISVAVALTLFTSIVSAVPIAERAVYAPHQQDNATLLNGPSINFTDIEVPQPVRGSYGGFNNFQQLDDEGLDRENPDILAAPKTDSGDVYNAKWPLSLSHNRLTSGGWARQQNEGVLPAATEMAGVNFLLKPWAYRELHWHTTNEWAFVFNGTCRVTSIDSQGRNFIDDVGAGDLWYFPQGDPHSLQALEDGCEFLLVFDSGSFSEDDTFLLTDWLSHIPKEVIAKNFGLPISDFEDLPPSQLYVFPGTPDHKALTDPSQNVSDPYGQVPQSFTYKFSEQKPIKTEGGSYKIVDSHNFPISKTIAAALVTIEPGAMRELHWHSNSDEWNIFLTGQARITVYAANSAARTFDYVAGDIGYIELNNGHYIENIGTETVTLLEILKADAFTDVSLAQWLAVSPPQVVKDHLKLPDHVIATLTASDEKKKKVVVK